MAEENQDDVVQAVYNFAAERMRNGIADDKIKKELVERGLDAPAAEVVVKNLADLRRQQKREAGQKNMLYGALWCVGGTLVTAATYSAAAGGGTYVVAWGAIVFGAVQFLQGVFQSAT